MSVDKINLRNWELLMNAVDEKKVVPIIGDNLIQVEVENGKRINIRDFILKALSERFNSMAECKDYSQIEELIREHNRQLRNAGDVTDIYYEIFDILRTANVVVPVFLKELFQICRFPLILTTSCARDINKDFGVLPNRIKVYNKNPSSDIMVAELDESSPTLYYLFGRLSMTKRSFKVTEDDLLDYLHCWHNSDSRPSHLGEYLSGKFLLVLGCDYPNWLFRFFWHSIRNFSIVPTTSDMQGVVTVSDYCDNSDEELMNFLSRVQTSVYRKAESFISEFIEIYKLRQEEKKESTLDTEEYENELGDIVERPDIFISYASEDYDIASTIAQKFKNFGAEVWFDKVDLDAGEKYEKIITEKIQDCKRFVPILSKSTLTPGRRFFKKEWKQAIEEASYRLNEPYITPISIGGFNPFIERGIPDEFTKEAHIINYNDDSFDSSLKRLIRSFR